MPNLAKPDRTRPDLSKLDLSPIEFGQALKVQASSDTLQLLLKRRSCSAHLLGLPGPTDKEMDILLKIGFRVPDHGKIGPWRMVRFKPEAKLILVEKLSYLAEARNDKHAVTALVKLSNPPEAVMVVYSPLKPHKIPEWEQMASSFAICQNLLIAAGAMGYGANWITDWYAYDAAARTILGLKDEEQVAGFIYIGTPTESPLERDRPDYNSRISWWEG
jgi:nitroreductase